MSSNTTPLNNVPIISDFLKLESASGILLMLSAVAAIIISNSPWQHIYELLLSTPVEVRIGAFEIAKPFLLWINDGLMAVFFFVVGLELKRELLEGELSKKGNIILPGVGAVGGMAIPALIYIVVNSGDETAMKGWAIPAATDIAFALGVLMLLGSKVPTSMKLFLTSLAIFDDIGAIVIIAIFYTDNLSFSALALASVCIPVLLLLNRKNITSNSPYIFVGTILWIATLKSGVHATLAGVILALFIPMRSKKNPDFSPVKELEHDLHMAVAYLILPIFAFANAGLSLSGIGAEQLFHSVPLGIAMGLFFGKQLGIFSLCWVAVKLKLASLPRDMNWLNLYGISALCGIGFTMSLFIGSLAFQETGVDRFFDERLGIIIGSLASGIVGYIILNFSLKQAATHS